MIPNQNQPAPAPSFAGLDGAEVQDRKPDIPPGTHLATIRNCRLSQTREAGLAFFAEVEIQGAGYAWKQFGVGADTDGGRLKRANIKQFFASVFGLDPSVPPQPGSTWDQVATEACAGDGTALAGRQVMVTAEQATARNGHAFTKCTWGQAPQQG